jgi:hypothetical protein
MVRVCGAIKVAEMAADAVLRGTGKLPIHVALLAVDADMAAGQRERSRRVVIEYGTFPLRRVVAALTGRREACDRMVWVCSAVEVSEVAADTLLRRTRVLTTNMALRAVNRSMCTSELEG